ncbi:MAG: hypothetical protein K2X39_06075 [Silvanigrellaceae bacterium]|nr:hypothetical protein [Silvanigrellaceae bacterium]
MTQPVFTIHPEYRANPRHSPYDIALITLNKPSLADLTAHNVDSACTPHPYKPEYTLYPGTMITVGKGSPYTYDTEPFRVGTAYGYVGLDVKADAVLTSWDVNITGYPAKVRGKTTTNMYTENGSIGEAKQGIILYDINTSGGQSGAGICHQYPDQSIELVGVHSGGYDEQYNYGVRIDNTVMNFLSKHLKAFDKAWASVNLP